jgi:phosphohistidine phosphatase
MLNCGRLKIDAIAMRLILLRHSKSERGEPGQRDRDRTLNKRGRDDAPKIGAYMARHDFLPSLVLVSPAQRTRETWAGVAPELGAPPRVIFDERLYESGPDSILSVIRETPAAAQTVLVVGHNPGLHDTARLLIASGDVELRERLNEALPTSGLVVIDFAGRDWRKLHPRSGRLEVFVTPRLLASATD